MKQRNPAWGCPRIAQQIALAFGIEVDKDMVRRILAAHYRARSELDRPLVADLSGPRKGQPLEHRFLPM